jgi:hypothetical protein
LDILVGRSDDETSQRFDSKLSMSKSRLGPAGRIALPPEPPSVRDRSPRARFIWPAAAACLEPFAIPARPIREGFPQVLPPPRKPRFPRRGFRLFARFLPEKLKRNHFSGPFRRRDCESDCAQNRCPRSRRRYARRTVFTAGFQSRLYPRHCVVLFIAQRKPAGQNRRVL